MMKKYILVTIVFACFQCRYNNQQPNLAVKDSYSCIPCGNSCDTIAFDHPGFCPVCHMALIKKPNSILSVTAHISNDYTGHWEGIASTMDQKLKFSLDIKTTPVTKVLFNATDLNAMDVSAKNITFKYDSIHFELAGDDAVTIFNAISKNGKLTGTLITDDQSVKVKNRTAFFELQKVTADPVNYTIQEVSFHNGNVVLAGSLYLPIGNGKFPALVCNHSSGDKPRYDGAFMADYMAKRGIAVLIYDKRGNGQSTGDWKTSSFEDLADDCIAGVHLLKSLPHINNKLIGIFGHSQGGTISPIIVDRSPDIAFNVAAACFAVSPSDQDVFRVTNILKHQAHLSEKQTDSAIRFYKIWLEVARTGNGWSGMEKENNKVKNAIWYSWVEPPPKNNWVWNWYLKTGNYNYVQYWEKIKIPTLLIYGDKDEITPVKPSLDRIQPALKKAGNKKYTVIIIPNAIHYFAQEKKEGDLWTQNSQGYLENIYHWIHITCSNFN